MHEQSNQKNLIVWLWATWNFFSIQEQPQGGLNILDLSAVLLK
jgi:hypothetical protein